MNKSNYRPVSVLPCISKIIECVLIDQHFSMIYLRHKFQVLEKVETVNMFFLDSFEDKNIYNRDGS